MLFLVVGAPGTGKTYLTREWILPTLLATPARLTPFAPRGGFNVALIDDPPRPQTGKQYPGTRFHDVSSFLAARRRARICPFDRARPEHLMRAALDCNGAVLVLDELDRVMPSGRKLAGDAQVIVEEGRHYGVAMIGTVRRLHAANNAVRTNAMGAWIGNLTDPRDQRYAAEITGIDRDALARLISREPDGARRARAMRTSELLNAAFRSLAPTEFIEWNRYSGRLSLVAMTRDGKKNLTLR